MTQTVHTKFTLETREGPTLTDQIIAASNYPVYIDNDKLFELRPVGTTLKGFGIDPDTLFDVDGPKETGEIFDIGNGAFDQSLNTTDSPTFESLTINNLTVNGLTTTVNSTTVTVKDPVFTLGGDTVPTSDDNKDRGIEFRWHDGTSAKLGFFGFDDSTERFIFIPDATNTSEVFTGTPGSVEFGTVFTDTISERTSSAGITFTNEIKVQEGIEITDGKSIHTGKIAGNTALFQAYDVDGGVFVTFATLTANDIPTMDLSSSVTVGGNSIQAFGAVLDDFNTLGAPVSDGQFIVTTEAGVFAYESRNTARTSLGVGTGDSPVFTGLTVGGIDIPTDVAANTAKITNATHTGEVTGATILTVDSTAISNKSLKSTLTGTEEVLINDAGTLKKTTSQDIADLNGGVSVFGGEFEKFESLGQSNNSSSTLQSKVDATTSVKPIGTYRIQFTTEVANSSGGNTSKVEFSIDGITTSNHANGSDFFEVSETNNNDWGAITLVVYKTLGSPATIDLDIKFANSSGTTARVFNSIIEIWRVS